MGLTINYRMTAPDGLSSRQAAALVRRLHTHAERLVAVGHVTRVHPISSDPEDLDRWACAWRSVPHPQFPDTSVGIAIAPEAGWIFPVDLGADSELLWLGLCRYPAQVMAQGRLRATRLGTRWRFSGFCKTQYASLHGWEHFVRCHLAAVDLLGQWREAGVRARINDEGGYWPDRSLANLRARLDQMNGIVAALGGALKDATDETGGTPSNPPFFLIRTSSASKRRGSRATPPRSRRPSPRSLNPSPRALSSRGRRAPLVPTPRTRPAT